MCVGERDGERERERDTFYFCLGWMGNLFEFSLYFYILLEDFYVTDGEWLAAIPVAVFGAFV